MIQRILATIAIGASVLGMYAALHKDWFNFAFGAVIFIGNCILCLRGENP